MKNSEESVMIMVEETFPESTASSINGASVELSLKSIWNQSTSSSTTGKLILADAKHDKYYLKLNIQNKRNLAMKSIREDKRVDFLTRRDMLNNAIGDPQVKIAVKDVLKNKHTRTNRQQQEIDKELNLLRTDRDLYKSLVEKFEERMIEAHRLKLDKKNKLIEIQKKRYAPNTTEQLNNFIQREREKTIWVSARYTQLLEAEQLKALLMKKKFEESVVVIEENVYTRRIHRMAVLVSTVSYFARLGTTETFAYFYLKFLVCIS